MVVVGSEGGEGKVRRREVLLRRERVRRAKGFSSTLRRRCGWSASKGDLLDGRQGGRVEGWERTFLRLGEDAVVGHVVHECWYVE